ncbi:MAG: hypothetical protein ACJ77K_10220 [Bacteroidia bacterium]
MKTQVMKNRTIINILIGILLFLLVILMNGCSKNSVDPDINGTWIEIDSMATQRPTGCELQIDKEKGDVIYCGFQFIQPKNTVGLFIRPDAKLYIKNGQMWYRQKKSDFVWIFPVAKQDLYFIDYDLNGDFLWIIGENTDTKTPAMNKGKLFMRK